jgi:lipid II:glycine glycyltransferase (peptidoglycan interpeptide bridge formation enzyme)
MIRCVNLSIFSVDLGPQTILSLPPESLGLQVLIATKNGQDLAAHVQSHLGDTAVLLFSATNRLGRTMNAGYQAFWSGMILAQQRGFSWYDLAGIDAIANPGLYSFKAKIRGQELVAIGPYEARPASYLRVLMDRLATRALLSRYRNFRHSLRQQPTTKAANSPASYKAVGREG